MEALAERIEPLWTQPGHEQHLIDDAQECLRIHFARPTAAGRSPVVLTERRKHLRLGLSALKDAVKKSMDGRRSSLMLGELGV